MENIFFQSSLPRAGSTLLQNIIGQRPDFYVTPTSGVLELVYASRNNFSGSPEFRAQDPSTMEKGYLSFCRAGLEGFFNAITDKTYILDKSRGWGYHYPFLNAFYPDPKIVCMIRDPRAIFASMEKNYQKSQYLDSGLVNHGELKGTTTKKRVDIWADTAPIGLAFERLTQMINEGTINKIKVVKFEDLTEKPQETMDGIYEYLGLDTFKHNFNNVKQITVEDDTVYGVFGDHTIKKKVKPIEKDYEKVLGKELSDNIVKHYQWFYEIFGYTN